LIKKERDFPLLLIIGGVIRGLLAFGILDLVFGSTMPYTVHGMD
jgi:hypothetical protein